MKKNKKLVERIEIENTPFTAVKIDENWILTMGKFKIANREFEHLQEIKDWIEKNNWNLIVTLIGIIIEFNHEQTKI